LTEREVKRIADKEFGSAATKYESSYPHPTRPSTEELNRIERKESFGPEAAAYEKHVHNALKEVARFKTGRTVLEETTALPDDLYVLPVGERDKVMLPNSNHTTCDGDLGHISATKASPAKSEKVPPIKYTPRDEKSCKPTKLFLPETTLLHELVHAVRPNKINLLKVSTGDAWDNLEEFFAVVTENIFRSERKQNDLLRGGHDDSVLHERLTTSKGFLQDKELRKRAEAVYKQEKLAQKLAKLAEIQFNPFAVIAGTSKP
jgi:hypothetical protein